MGQVIVRLFVEGRPRALLYSTTLTCISGRCEKSLSLAHRIISSIALCAQYRHSLCLKIRQICVRLFVGPTITRGAILLLTLGPRSCGCTTSSVGRGCPDESSSTPRCSPASSGPSTTSRTATGGSSITDGSTSLQVGTQMSLRASVVGSNPTVCWAFFDSLPIIIQNQSAPYQVPQEGIFPLAMKARLLINTQLFCLGLINRLSKI